MAIPHVIGKSQAGCYMKECGGVLETPHENGFLRFETNANRENQLRIGEV